MSTPTMDEAGKVFADPLAYTDEPKLHAALAHLRANGPVSRVEVPNYRPFWAITKHADIMDIERDNMRFTNWPRPVLTTAEGDELQAAAGVRTLIHLDDPQHRVVRAIGADWFRPKAMRALKVRVDELAKNYVDKMMAVGPECDFVQEVAVNYPLYVIMSLLGIPESDFPRMLKLTQELFGSDDSEFKRGSTNEDQLPALLDMFGYFNAVTASRREHPTEDLASAIANARIDGEPLSDIDTVSYYLIVATAGHDTTSATISGGLHALTENPDQLHAIARQSRLDAAGHRGDDPMGHSGQGIHAHRRRRHHGARGPDRSGGVGAAVVRVGQPGRGRLRGSVPLRCRPRSQQASGIRLRRALRLGAALARMEVNSFFAELLPRLKSIELIGDPEFVATTFVGGLKHLPVRYSLR